MNIAFLELKKATGLRFRNIKNIALHKQQKPSGAKRASYIPLREPHLKIVNLFQLFLCSIQLIPRFLRKNKIIPNRVEINRRIHVKDA